MVAGETCTEAPIVHDTYSIAQRVQSLVAQIACQKKVKSFREEYYCGLLSLYTFQDSGCSENRTVARKRKAKGKNYGSRRPSSTLTRVEGRLGL